MTNPLVSAARALATETAAKHADAVDDEARFPIESLQAMRSAGLLSASVPVALGGGGCSLTELGHICSSIAHGCGSSAMVLAMHYSQVACLVRHAADSPFFVQYLRELCDKQYLLASMTSEIGTFGDTRTSICAVEADGAERFRLAKDATTGSYCQHADGILVTCRRNSEAAGSDQVLVLLRKGDYELTQTTTWDTLGMRGTCSPGFKLSSGASLAQILPGEFAHSSAQSMVPFSHVLWSSLWHGIVSDAVGRAAAFVRGEARKKPGVVPSSAVRLAALNADLQALRNNWLSVARDFDALSGRAGLEDLLSMGWALRLNGLKMTAADAAPALVHRALQIVGVLGYKNDSPFSVGRHYRDVLSASLMISNDRIAAKNASMLLVFKDEST